MFDTISPIFRDSLIKMADHYAEHGVPPKKGITPVGRQMMTASGQAIQETQEVPEGEDWAAQFVKQTVLAKLASASPQEFGLRTMQVLRELRGAIDSIESGMGERMGHEEPQQKQASVKIVSKGF